jgi:hypothetical protein
MAAALLAANIAAARPQMSLPGSFEVTPTGAAVYSIPIAVPALTLDDVSQTADAVLAVGWSLGGSSAVRGRSPRTTIGGVNCDASDRFCLDGQQLVDGADGAEYRSEIEGFTDPGARPDDGARLGARQDGRRHGRLFHGHLESRQCRRPGLSGKGSNITAARIA